MIGMTDTVILWKKGVKKSLEARDEVRAERAETYALVHKLKRPGAG